MGARVGLAFAQAWQGHLERARAAFRELLGANPLSVDAWNGLGFVDRTALRREDAEAAYQRALELDPQNKDEPPALKELHWDRRTDVRVLGGGSVIPDGAWKFESRVDFASTLSPGVTIGGGYQQYLRCGSAHRRRRTRERTDRGLAGSQREILRPSRRFTLGNSLYTFFSDDTTRGVVWEEAVWQITPHCSLIGNFRPAFSSSEPHWLFAAVGKTVSLTTRSRLTVRALVAADTEFEPRLTLLADYGVSFSRRFQMQLSVGHSSSDQQFAFTSFGVTANWLMTPSFGLAVIASNRIETFERTRVLVGVQLRR